MYAILPRFLIRIYRKEPISSFLLTIGGIDAFIGGVNGEWNLFSFSVIILLLAIGIRWWHLQNPKDTLRKKTPQKYLPPSLSSQPLPILKKQTKNRR